MADEITDEEVPPHLFPEQDEASIMARARAWANEGLDPADDPQSWTDTREGSHWHLAVVGFVREMARLYDHAGRVLPQVAFAHLAWGEFLDLHAYELGTRRNAAVPASGTVTFTGDEGAEIPAGTPVGAPVALADSEPPTYATTTTAVLGADGTADVPVVAQEAGSAGSVSAGAVTSLLSSLPGVQSVTNAEPMVGGVGEESDEALRRRLAGRFGRAVANHGYYRQLLGEVDGVGRVRVTANADGPGTIGIVIATDENEAVSASALAAARALVAPPSEEAGSGQGQTGATITVESASVFTVNVAATIELEPGYTLDAAPGLTPRRDVIRAAVAAYVESPATTEEVVNARVLAALVGVPGVYDSTPPKLNAAAVGANLAVPQDPPGAAVLGTLTLTVA